MSKYILRITLFIFTAIIFLAVTNDFAKAEYFCNPPPDYCIGQVINSVPNGCQLSGGACVYTFTQIPVGCNSDCVVDYPFYPAVICGDTSPNPGMQCGITGSGYPYPLSNTNCCVSSGGGGGGGNPDDCNENGICDGDENWQICPAECPPPDTSACGDNCFPGTADCGSGGLSCDTGTWHCNADPNCDYCNNNPLPSDCYRACWGPVCSGAQGTAEFGGNFYTSTSPNWPPTGAGISYSIPLVIVNQETNEIYANTTSSGGGFLFNGALFDLSADDNYGIVPYWTYYNILDSRGFPFAPPGHKGPALTMSCDNDERCGAQTPSQNNNVYSGQSLGSFNPGIGLFFGDDCGSERFWNGSEFQSVGQGRNKHCDFYYRPLANTAPEGTVDTFPAGIRTIYSNTVEEIYVNMSDVDGNMNAVRVYIRKADDATGTSAWYSGSSWVEIDPGAISIPGNCNGATCVAPVTLDFAALFPGGPSTAPGGTFNGHWWVAVNAFDTFGLRLNDPETGWCSGNPGVTTPSSGDLPAGWVQCDYDNNADAFMLNVIEPTYTISGNIQEATYNPVAQNCTGAVNLDASLYTPDITVTYDRDPIGGPGNISTTITNGSTYSISGAIGPNGTLLLNTITLNTTTPIQYRLRCFNGNFIAAASVPISVLANLPNQNFQFERYNPFVDGWLSAYNGDVYVQSAAATIPDSPQGGVTDYYANYFGTRDTIMYGQDISGVASDKRAYGTGPNVSKHVDDLSGDFWPENFSFTPPPDCVGGQDPNTCTTLITANDIRNNTLQVNRVYRIQENQMRNYFNNTVSQYATYDLQPNGTQTTGVAVIYVVPLSSDPIDPDDPTDQILIRGKTNYPTAANQMGVWSANANERILLISQNPIIIEPTIGYTVPGAIPDLTTARAHIEMGIISQHQIEYRSVGVGSNDRILVMDGPVVAGNGNASPTATINLFRNLNDYNGLYPAVVVRKNPMFLLNMPLNSGVHESTVYYKLRQ